MKRKAARRCLWCGELIDEGDLLNLFRDDDPLCADCRSLLKKEEIDIMAGELPVHSLYRYDGTGREMLLQYKELMDEALYPVFFYPYVKKLERMYRDYTIVPLPPSSAGYARRGFSHVPLMFSLLKLPVADILEKPPLPEQKTLNRNQRYIASRRIRLKEGAVVPPGKILLADDLITTGASLQSACRCLEGQNNKIRALTSFAHLRFYEEKNKKNSLMDFLECL